MSSRYLPAGAVVLVCAALATISVSAADLPPLLRFPDVYGDTVVFVHGEDIWTASVAGGRAIRLTDDEGEEWSPKFSPDGSSIAFSAEIDGNPDVYVMNSDGSDVRRLTFHPGDDEVVGWHPTTGKILFRSAATAPTRVSTGCS